MADKVWIFWDNSNIYIPAKNVSETKEGVLAKRNIRIQFSNLFRLARASRDVVKAICVGSVPPELEDVWARLKDTGIKVELYERGGKTGKEQGVDQCLQVHMLRALADAKNPGVAVLLTGDGAGYYDGVGYHADIERMKKNGWGVEVLSWDIACNQRLRTWAKEKGVYIPLEDYYNTVTFIEGGRVSKPLSLIGRPVDKTKS